MRVLRSADTRCVYVTTPPTAEAGSYLQLTKLA